MEGFTPLWVVPGPADPLPVPRVQWVEDNGTDVVPERDPSSSELSVEYPPEDPQGRAAWHAKWEVERQAHLASLPELDATQRLADGRKGRPGTQHVRESEGSS